MDAWVGGVERRNERDKEKNRNRGREEEERSRGRAGYNNILTPLRISQRTTTKKPKDTNAHHAFVILCD